ncbi:MAG TPA: UvrD-helicase domain-containing protein [Patescibacteria group bacterium]|nr:UvrD-helicase domain-containing protein [Patescibacteria group bacterium]
MDDILHNLNEEQRLAVTHIVGKPAMVLAGAGSGKTRVLTTRAAWLLKNAGLAPENILLVTFTNKAAQEMVERMERLTGYRLPFAGTFHRLCARILRRHGIAVGLSPGFAIYDSDDAESLIGSILSELGYAAKEVRPRVIAAIISSAKNELVGWSEYAGFARGKYQEIAARVYKIYQQRLLTSDAADFDDLLFKTAQLLSEQEFVKREYNETFKHILIDEYQDTNTAQLALTKLLVNGEQNLFVVGDFSQAIYSFRGADFRNMLTLKEEYPEITTYELSQNYRSSQNILDAASGVISHNSHHPVLQLWTQALGGEDVTVFEGDSDFDEVNFVTSKITRRVSDSTVAILYRTNAQSRGFEEGLIRAGIAYRLVGGTRFYARKEIKDLLAYLRLTRGRDEVARSRIEKLGKRKLSAFEEWLTKQVERATFEGKTVTEVLDAILIATQYLAQFDENDEEDRGRLENIEELRSVAGAEENIGEFLERIALLEEEALRKVDPNEEEAKVLLMSVHAAKGLEFDEVFVVGMEEGLFPHSRSLLDPLQMEEERRLCYVAFTRARYKLNVSFARRRMLYGRPTGSVPSRFVAEIPANILERKGSSHLASSSHPSFVPKTRFDDPSIDDFLSGSMDVSSFLES